MPPPHGNTRGAQNIHRVHIADGFADDCEELIYRWLRTDTLTYETFCEIWKDMQFNFLYHGRSTGTEMAELSEEFIHIAKHYMVSNTDNFEESVAGLFLVYGLLHLQPYQRFASLRIVPDDVAPLARLETVARREKRYDVLYILASVLIEGPVQYHIAARERGMESSLRKYLEGTTGIDRIGVRPKGVFFRQNEELDMLRELDAVTKKYVEVKKSLGGNVRRDLDYVNVNLAEELARSLKEVINGITDEGEEGNKKITDHYNKVQEIKRRAMKQTVDPVKHLDTVSARHQTRERKKGKRRKIKPCQEPIEDEPIKPKSNETTPIKRCSPLPKLFGSCDVKKSLLDRRRIISKRTISTSSGTTISSDSSDEDSPIDDSETPAKNNTPDGDKEINLANFDKDKANEKTDMIEKPANVNEINVANKDIEMLDLQIDTLPVLIRSESDGKVFEIEIIDEMNQTPNTENTTKSKTQVPVDNSDPGEGTSGVANAVATVNVTRIKGQKVSNKIPLLAKIEKRNQKKTVIKSKFKSMGLLNIANFEDTPRKSTRNLNKSKK